MVARGARRGQGAITKRAAERRKSPQNTLLSTHPGLAIFTRSSHGSRRGLPSIAAPQLLPQSMQRTRIDMHQFV